MDNTVIAILVSISLACFGFGLRYYVHHSSRIHAFRLAKISVGNRILDKISTFYEISLDYWTSDRAENNKELLAFEIQTELFFDDVSRSIAIFNASKKDQVNAKILLKQLKTFQLGVCPPTVDNELLARVPLDRTDAFVMNFTTHMIDAKTAVEAWLVDKTVVRGKF